MLGFALILIILLGGFYLLYTAFKDRICEKCDIKMTAHYPYDSYIPDYYICTKCGNKKYTNIKKDAPI